MNRQVQGSGRPGDSRDRKRARVPVTGEAGDPAGKILVVGGEPEFRVDLRDRLNQGSRQCTHVSRIDEAQTALAGHRFDLIMINTVLSDGDGLEFASFVRKKNPSTATIIFSATASYKSALGALRCGAVDFIRTPVDLDELVDRVDAALVASRTERSREQRIRKLHGICQELHDARDEISGRVDVLCNDLVSAYQELTDQISEVAMASEFRTLLRQELDIEDLLRTTLEFLLSKTGPTNAAVFLPDPDQRYSLGAYVNYDCPRESIDNLLDHLGEAICPQMSDELDLVRFDDSEQFSEWIGMDDALLGESQVVAFSCMHEGECLAVLILFRNRSNPFDSKLAGILDILRSIFAEQLSHIIRVHHRAVPDWPGDAHEDDSDYDEFGFGFGGLAA